MVRQLTAMTCTSSKPFEQIFMDIVEPLTNILSEKKTIIFLVRKTNRRSTLGGSNT